MPLWKLLALALLAWLAAVPAALAADRPPNIVLLIVDDLGYADVGVQGLRGIPTPHLDTIARTGVRLTAGYVAAPVCSPSRAAIMTGRYPQRFGIYDNAPTSTSDPRFGLPRGQPTLAERLRALGYRTALFGKWHLGSPAWQRPNARGFEETLTFLNSGGHRYFGTPAQPNLLYRGDRVVAEPDYLTFAFAREAVSFIHRSADAPFFLAVPFSAVHPPQEAPADYIARFAAIGDKKRRLMAAMLSTLDDATGRILAALREEGLKSSTLIFFVSDNGGDPAKNASRNDPFSGAKGDLLEGGIRVPFFVRWPGHLPAGAVYDRPVSSLDIAATALAAAGYRERAVPALDGVDLVPYLTGRRDGEPHAALYWRYTSLSAPQSGQAAIRSGDYKLLRRGGRDALYDLARDPRETRDLAAAQPERADGLRRQLDAWMGGLVPQVQ